MQLFHFVAIFLASLQVADDGLEGITILSP